MTLETTNRAYRNSRWRLGMHIIGIFILLLMAGCSETSDAIVFNIRTADVANATAEPLDRPASADTNTPEFQAQLHIVFTDAGAAKFRRFAELHAGMTYEFQVNEETLLPMVHAQPTGGKEVWWYTRSMAEAKHFADSLTQK